MPSLEKYVVRDGGPPPRSLWQRAGDALRSFTLGPLSLSDPELRRKLNFGGGPTASGVSVTEAAALRHAPFWAAVTTIAADVASLPLVVYKRRADGGQERDQAHRIYPLLHDEFNPEMSAMTGRETLLLHALVGGNAYAEIERDGAGRAVALWPLLPTQVAVARDERRRLIYHVRSETSTVTLDAADVLHVSGPSPDGILGYDVVHQAREALGLGMAAERFGATFFGHGTAFGGVLSHPKVLGPDGAKNLRASIEALHQGSDRAHRFLIAEEGMTYTRLGVDPEAAQFNATRVHQLREVCRFYKMPPSKLGDTERTFASVEQESLSYFVSCVRPWCVRIEQELNRKLFSRAERLTHSAQHVVEGFLRADTEKRGNYYAQALAHGWASVDEVRRLEGLPPLPNGAGAIPRVPMNTEALGSDPLTKENVA